MRTRFLPALCLAAVACRGDDRPPAAGAGVPTAGPDPIVLRLPSAGGTVRAFAYPGLDSMVWRSAQATPRIDRVLAFDPENGVLALASGEGAAGWLDLRLGTWRSAGRRRFSSVASSDGWSIYGQVNESTFTRTTPSGDWSFTSHRTIHRLLPLPDGALLLLGRGPTLFRMRPPDDVVTDSVASGGDIAVSTPVGDRVYLADGRRLTGVPPGDIGAHATYEAGETIVGVATTPSGDRVFLATQGQRRLEVVNRYSGDVEESLELPGVAAELRMDPVGRFLLARPAKGDSAWVVDIGTERLVGAVETAWRTDLPAVAVDGRVATLRGADVALVTPGSSARALVIPNGAADVWFFTRWNGFRPRARGIDAPVSFVIVEDSALPPIVDMESAAGAVSADSTAVAHSPAPRPVTAPAPSSNPPAAATFQRGWSVSFAAVLSQARARAIADSIVVDGRRPRIAVSETAGTAVYRVVFGPFVSRGEADRVGRTTGRSYWVIEDVP